MISRDDKQQQFISLWLGNNCKGGLAAITSFGKTRTAIKCALQSGAVSTTIIVPTKDLRKQWAIQLKEWNVPNHHIYIVNTAANLHIKTDLLILDEAHTVGMANWFQLSWKNASFNKLLWLSATPERKDNNHLDLFKMGKKLMSITYQEALENGWISDYTMYNVGITLTNEEQLTYNKIDLSLEQLYKEMHNFFPKNVVDIEYIKKKAFEIAGEFLSTKDWNKGKLGKQYYNLIGQRKTLLYNAENKLVKTVNYIKKNVDKKILVFSQSQDFADKLQVALGDICVTIHSGLSDKFREENLIKFRDKRTKVRVISSVKALNEGIDIPELDVGICVAGTSSKKDGVQMLGRVCRLYGDKHSLFFNLYIKGSQDLYWLNNRTYSLDKNRIQWI